MEWNADMSAAPRDRKILVFAHMWAGEIGGVEQGDEGDCYIASYSNGSSDYGETGWWDVEGGDGYASWCYPVAWMPLPDAPQSLAEGF